MIPYPRKAITGGSADAHENPSNSLHKETGIFLAGSNYAVARFARLERGGLRTYVLAQLFSCQRTPRRPTSPSMRPDRPTPHAARPRRGHAWRPPPALPASLNAPAWLSQNAIAVSGGPPGATALSCSHPPQESTRMHRSTLGRT